MKSDTLFPVDLPGRDWVTFDAAGFSEPVSDIISRSASVPCCGAPIGGIGTGCLDFDSRGVIGFSTIFNSSAPRESLRFLPLAAVSIHGEAHLLVTDEIRQGGEFPLCYDRELKDPAARVARRDLIDGVHAAREIHYWGTSRSSIWSTSWTHP